MASKLGYFGHIARKKMFDVSGYVDRGWPTAQWMDENLRIRHSATEFTKAAQNRRQ